VFVVVSHPFDEGGAPSSTYRVLSLSSDGQIRAGERFTMGSAHPAAIAFLPDSSTGVVAQEDGNVGVFRLDRDGRPTVIHPGLAGSFFASGVRTSSHGNRVWVLDAEWIVHGGGIYSFDVQPDGTCQEQRQVLKAKLPYALEWLSGSTTRAVVAGHDIIGSPEGTDLHILDLKSAPRRTASATAFGDGEAIVSAMALTSDERYALVADNNEYSRPPNRVMVAAVGEDEIVPVQAFTPIPDPVAMVASPFGGPVLVTSGYGNAIFVLDYDPHDRVAPFSFRGELAYHGAPPSLPGVAVCIERGRHAGRAFIAESDGLRRVDFLPTAGGVVDRGVWKMDVSPGALGVAPVCPGND